MSLVEFLTSKEIVVVYAIAAVASLLCFIIYIVEMNKIKALKKHNTKELNKLVEEIKDEYIEMDEVKESVEVPTIVETTLINEEKENEISVSPIITKIEPVEEVQELEYVEAMPSITEAQEVLEKAKEELEKNETENIDLTIYEQEQEDNAIISLEELVKKGKEIYENNELRDYSEDITAPISLNELEKKVGKTASSITDTFIIENVVSEEEVMEELEPTIIENKEVVEVEKKFKSSPFISPIFGIEKEMTPKEIELENTANYDKLDAEIKKTNEFLMTLKELQKNLD